MATKKSPTAIAAKKPVSIVVEGEGTILTPEQKRRLRARNIAVASMLFGLIVLFYLITIFKIGGNIADRAI